MNNIDLVVEEAERKRLVDNSALRINHAQEDIAALGTLCSKLATRVDRLEKALRLSQTDALNLSQRLDHLDRSINK